MRLATSSSTRRGRQSGADLKPPQAAVVKSHGGERCGNAGTRFQQARSREASASEPLQVSKGICDVKTGGSPILRDQLGGCLRLPERHPAYRRREARPGFVRNVRTWPAMLREKTQAATTARSKVPMRRRGADCLVLAMKRGNARGAKGAGHRHWIRVNQQWEEPNHQWKAAAFMRWHEPYESRGSRTESVRGSG